MHRLKAIFALVTIAFLGACARDDSAPAAQVDKAALEAVKVRQSLLRLFKHNYGPMAGMARGKVPFNAAVVGNNAVRLEQLSKMFADVFVTDTRDSGAPTEALDRIWEDSATFSEKVDALTAAATALAQVASGGDEATVIAAIKEVGGSCGSCHDDFKKDD